MLLVVLLALPRTSCEEVINRNTLIPSGQALTSALSGLSGDPRGVVTFELPAGVTVNLTSAQARIARSVSNGQLRIVGGDVNLAPSILDLASLAGASVSAVRADQHVF